MTMVYLRTFHESCAIIICLIMFFLSHLSATGANNGGFSVKLIRKNSLHVLPQRVPGLGNAKTVQSPTSTDLSEYIMELSIGTPPFTIYGIMDTGSDLIWTQCVPCKSCYKQLHPMFDPQKSSTYRSIPCDPKECHILDTAACSPEKLCSYTYGYGDSSLTQGNLARERVTLISSIGKPVSLEGIIFGCGHNNSGVFNDHAMGIIGLGRGSTSLISQIGSSFGSRSFSQCLLPFNTDINVSSTMNFGKGSEVSGNGVVSTPLVVDKPDKTLYFVTLIGISVGDIFLNFNDASETVARGNMFIDSGTPPTILPQKLYDQVVAEIKRQVALTPIKDDPELGSQLCYQTTKNLDGPMLKAHFEGADILLTPTQTFIPTKSGVFCFGMTNTSNDVGVYGNYAQSNYLIGFDLERLVVSFKQTDCTKH